MEFLRKMECVKLKAGLWSACVLPDFGANLIELSYDGQRLLRSPASLMQLEENPYLYGNPFLLPPNRTRDGRFEFEGRKYDLPVNEQERHNHIHGLMYNAPFTVTGSTDHELYCCYENKGERYPFPFSALFHYELSQDGLFLNVVIGNDGDNDMPLLVGFHTTFAAPKTFAVALGKRWERTKRFLPTGRLAELNKEEELIRRGKKFEEGEPLSGFYTADGHWARVGDFLMETSENFTQWILFNGGGGEGYLCVEPQSGPVNGLNVSEMCQVVKKGQTQKYWLRFRKSTS